MNSPPRQSPDRLIISLEQSQLNRIVTLYANPTRRRLNLEFNLNQIRGREQAFLRGLESLVDLGLLSEAELRQVCRTQLICQLPLQPSPVPQVVSPSAPAPAVTPVRSTAPAVSPVATPVRSTAPADPPGVTAAPPPQLPPGVDKIRQMVQALVAEISVIWLLALGVFLVVLSSAALALTQWQTFSPSLQYGMLWIYTLGFAGASLWTQGKERLALTSQGLRATALFLLPLNLWAIEGLQLWRSGFGWIVIGIAVATLGVMGRSVLRLQGLTPFGSLLYGLLSLLHLGWILPGISWLAPYGGVLVGGWGLLRGPLGRRANAEDLQRVGGWWGWGLILFGSGLLLVRSGILYGFQPLGLAVLIWGLLLSRGLPGVWRWRAPLIALGLAWVITIGSQPAQALVISGIGLGVVWFRLTRYWQPWDLVLLVVIGAESLSLVGRLLPEFVLSGVADLSVAVGIPPWGAVALLGFPYTWGILSLARWLERQGKPNLGIWGERLSGGLGGVIFSVCSFNPGLRLAAVALLTLTWGSWQRLHPGRRDLIYLTHGAGVLSAMIWIDGIWPELRTRPQIWGLLLLFGLVVEWGWKGWRGRGEAWGGSAWILGWGLAFLSGSLLLIHGITPDRSAWVLLGLITPALLIWRGRFTSPPNSSTPILITIGLAQLLWILQPQLWPFAFGISAGLSLGTSWIYPAFLPACCQIGFTLAALSSGIWQFLVLPPGAWVGGTALVGNGLILAGGYWDRWHRRSPAATASSLILAYRKACYTWAIVILTGLLMFLNLHSYQIQIQSETLILSSAAWSLIWLLTPVTLLALTWGHPRDQRARWAQLGGITLAAGQLLWLPFVGVREWGVGATALLLGIGVFLSPTVELALGQIGVSLAWIGLSLWDGVQPDHWGWSLSLGSIAMILWMVREFLRGRTGSVASVYGRALQLWGSPLLVLTGIMITLQTALLYTHTLSPNLTLAGATGITLIALGIRSWRGIDLWGLWGWIWGIELITAQGVALFAPEPGVLSGVTIGLGLLAQISKGWWIQRVPLASARWQGAMISLSFGILALLLRVGIWEPWTGITTLGVAILLLEIGRGSEQTRGFVHLGWIGAGLATGEFLWAQTIQLPVTERLLLLSSLGTLWVYGTQALTGPLGRYLQLPDPILRIYIQGYWILATGLWLLGISGGITSYSIGLGSGSLLAGYALFQGRRGSEVLRTQEIWTSIGLIFGLIWLGVQVTLLPALGQEILVPWVAGFSVFPAAIAYRSPWSSWGWPLRPWRTLAWMLPLGLTAITINRISLPSVLLAAGFYALLAVWDRNWRWTDLSGVLITGALWRIGFSLEITSGFAYLSPVGLLILWISHTEPAWQGSSHRSLRHGLRLIGLGLILLPCWLTQAWGLTILLSLISVMLGLALKIRAYLLLGTSLFLLSTLQHTGALVIANSFSRWISLLALGLGLIIGAATFESYRTKLKDLWISLMGQIQAWE